MAADLDCADLAEVHRRVVTPVVGSLIHPEELDSAVLQFGPPRGYRASFRHDAPEVWLTLVARGEEFCYRVAKATFERWDVADVSGELAWALEEWLPETSFAWGQLRTTDNLDAPPPRRHAAPSGVRVVEVFPDEQVESELWDTGGNVTAESLGLTTPLCEALVAWTRRVITIWEYPRTTWAAA